MEQKSEGEERDRDTREKETEQTDRQTDRVKAVSCAKIGQDFYLPFQGVIECQILRCCRHHIIAFEKSHFFGAELKVGSFWQR